VISASFRCEYWKLLGKCPHRLNGSGIRLGPIPENLPIHPKLLSNVGSKGLSLDLYQHWELIWWGFDHLKDSI
jgi:hypothetical protein